MHPEAIFLAGYALALTVVSIGLELLGRRSTDPWSSRTLAACEPPAERTSRQGPDWPHSEVPVFHLGLSAVALVAAAVITVLSIVRHSGPVELVTHGTLLVVISVRIRHLITRHRTLTRGERRRPLRSIDSPDTRGLGSE